MKKQILYIVLLLMSGLTFGQNPVQITVDTTSIRIGEQIKYQIQVNQIDNVLFSQLELDSLNRIELVKDLKVDTTRQGLIKNYVLTSFEGGQFMMPSQSVMINNKIHKTDSLLIDVASVKVDSLKQGLYALKAIKGEPIVFDDYKNYIWIIIGVILLILAVVIFLLKYKKKEKIPEEERIPPYELAMINLGRLDEKQLWQNNQVKQYYIELIDIVRTYIERELKIPALELTTDELIDTIKDFDLVKKYNLPKEIVTELEELLQDADLVKFAKHKPVAVKIETDRKEVEKIINTLKPKSIEEDVE